MRGFIIRTEKGRWWGKNPKWHGDYLLRERDDRFTYHYRERERAEQAARYIEAHAFYKQFGATTVLEVELTDTARCIPPRPWPEDIRDDDDLYRIVDERYYGLRFYRDRSEAVRAARSIGAAVVKLDPATVRRELAERITRDRPKVPPPNRSALPPRLQAKLRLARLRHAIARPSLDPPR